MVVAPTPTMASPQAPPAVEEFLEFDLPETSEFDLPMTNSHDSPASSSSSSCHSTKTNNTTGGIGVPSRKRGIHSDQGIHLSGMMTPPENISLSISRKNSLDLSSRRRKKQHRDGGSTGVRSPQVGSDLFLRALQKTCVSASRRSSVSTDIVELSRSPVEMKHRSYSNSSTIGSTGGTAIHSPAGPTPEYGKPTDQNLTVKIVGSSADPDAKPPATARCDGGGPCIWHLDVFFGVEDEKNAVHAKRRYRQFLALHEDLQRESIKIGCPFPPRYCALSTPTEAQLERRRKSLSIWLEEAIHKSFGHPNAWTSVIDFVTPEFTPRTSTRKLFWPFSRTSA